MQFGARSERLPEAQVQLGFEALEQAELRKGNVARRRANRGALPAHLACIQVTLPPGDAGAVGLR
jgi:transposase